MTGLFGGGSKGAEGRGRNLARGCAEGKFALSKFLRQGRECNFLHRRDRTRLVMDDNI